MNQEPENNGGGAAPVEAPPAGEPNEAAGDQEFDEFGYPKDKGAPDTTGENKPEPEPAKAAAEPTKVEKPASGYQAAPKVDGPVVEPPKVEEIKLEFELEVDKEVPANIVQDLKKFALDNKVTKEVAQALLNKTTQDFKAHQAQMVQAQNEAKNVRQQTHSKWFTELKQDPTFGGDKFEANVHQAERVLEQFMPNTKKTLTEKGSMLPPYVMRDLAKLADVLYSSESLKTGDPTTPPAPEKNFLDEMYS